MLHALLLIHCIILIMLTLCTHTKMPSNLVICLTHIQGPHAQRMSVRIMVVTEASLPVLCDLGPGSTFQKRSVSSPASARRHSNAEQEPRCTRCFW